LDQQELEFNQSIQEENEVFQIEEEEDIDDLIGEQLKENYHEDNIMDIWKRL
jgi:hypothetical protein